MKQIPLTQGKFALVDDEDFEYLNQWKWYFNCGYAKRYHNKKTLLMHVFLMGYGFDHKDRNGINNTRINLREATHQENSFNRRRQNGIIGVSLERSSGFFKAYIGKNGKQKTIGRYKTLIEAQHARDAEALKQHGEFACLNFPSSGHTNKIV